MKRLYKMSYNEKMEFLGKMTEAELGKFVDDNISEFNIVSGSAWKDAKGDKELKITMVSSYRMDYGACPKCNDIFCTLNWTKNICHSCKLEEINA